MEDISYNKGNERLRFFDLNGKMIDEQEFISIYSKEYFLGGEGNIPEIRRSSYYIENEICKILKNGISGEDDVTKVMAWKIGRIKHKESDISKNFVFSSDWEETEKHNPSLYGKRFNLKKISEFIVSDRKKLSALAKNKPQEFLNKLRDQDIEGLGTVYMIALLFFMSGGDQPIYDRFAMAALKAVYCGICPSGSDKVSVRGLPDKKSKAFNSVVEKEYGCYIKMLSGLETDYRKCRDLDRALWVYGHLVIEKCTRR
ncbi:MAG: hypothetical protein K5848_03795 [Lachnospiraceae bacterium]|nr:hypothetical protein [Lachnospiraceae bacterium]